MHSRERWWQLAIGCLLVILFVVSRLYKIESTLLFFIDIGRDNNVLFDWYQTGRPPLLGPQTSALPFNQSAFYFYLLYPLAWLTRFSAFSTIYTNVVFYLLVFGGLAVAVRKNAQLVWLILGCGLVVTFHPQFIIQNRFVWNPSWVGPMVVLGFVSWLQLMKQWSWRWLIASALGFAAAASFNYSAAPVTVAAVLLSIYYFRRRSIWFVGCLLAAGLVLNGTTVLFELRHNFPLTKMMLYQPKLAQTETSIHLKTRDLLRFGVEMPSMASSYRLGLALGILIAISWWWLRKTSVGTDTYTWFTAALWFFLVSLVITYLMPVSILSHYIFGVVTLGIILICLLPVRVLLPILFTLVIVWSRPEQVSKYLQPARRTVAEMERCFQAVCSDHRQPLFVSVQAGFHPFHAAQEHRFLMRRNGCQVPAIDVEPQAAQYMAVVADGSTYDHGQTAYNELTQFGPSQVVKLYDCQENFQVYLLKR